MVIGGILTAAVFVVPLLTIGAPDYTANDWPRALLWSAVALLVAPMVHHVVEQLALESRRANLAGAEVASLMDGARLTSMIATDTEGRVTAFSVGAEEMLGYSAADMIGRNDLGALHDLAEVAAVAEELGVEPGFPVLAELARVDAPSRIWTYIRRDGSRLHVRLAITDLKDDRGAVIGYLGVAIDTTSAVVAERALVDAEARWRIAVDHLPEPRCSPSTRT